MREKTKVSKAKKGQRNSIRTGFKKGHTPWNKGLKGFRHSGSFQKGNKYRFKKGHPKPKNSYSFLKGHKHSEEVRIKIREANKGHKASKKTRLKISDAMKGERCYRWKGGITPKRIKIRKSIEYRLWREAVFARDNWTCQKCKERGGKLRCHHIKNFAQYPELRFDIDNGITLCKKCHKVFHKKYSNQDNTKEQLEEFLSRLDAWRLAPCF